MKKENRRVHYSNFQEYFKQSDYICGCVLISKLESWKSSNNSNGNEKNALFSIDAHAICHLVRLKTIFTQNKHSGQNYPFSMREEKKLYKFLWLARLPQRIIVDDETIDVTLADNLNLWQQQLKIKINAQNDSGRERERKRERRRQRKTRGIFNTCFYAILNILLLER